MANATTRSASTSVPRGVDVARLAGVSPKTVSRVLNNEPYVSEQVRHKVREAAQALGYRLNGAARALASGRTHSIGVVTLGSALYGPASLLRGIGRAARGAGYAVRVVNTIGGEPDGIAGAVESLLEQGVDGIVIAEPIDEGDVAINVDVPVLVFDAPSPFAVSNVVTVRVGAEFLAATATAHLLDLGHPTVHHLAGPQRWYAARDRLTGWRAALAARHRREPPIAIGDWTPASGYAVGLELARDPGVTAVFAANDDMAIGLIRALAEAGRRVPEDVSVVGFDDVPVAVYVTPPLTTVRQPFDALAVQGLGLLVQAIENPGTQVVQADAPPVDLVIRSSTGPAPTGQRIT